MYNISKVFRIQLKPGGMNYGHGTGHGVGHFLNVHEGPHQFRPIRSGSDEAAGRPVYKA